jgi:hypothetical protein
LNRGSGTKALELDPAVKARRVDALELDSSVNAKRRGVVELDALLQRPCGGGSRDLDVSKSR